MEGILVLRIFCDSWTTIGKFRESSKDNLKWRVKNVEKLEELGEESIKMIIFKYT